MLGKLGEINVDPIWGRPFLTLNELHTKLALCTCPEGVQPDGLCEDQRMGVAEILAIPVPGVRRADLHNLFIQRSNRSG